MQETYSGWEQKEDQAHLEYDLNHRCLPVLHNLRTTRPKDENPKISAGAI